MGATSEYYIGMQNEIMSTIDRSENGHISVLDALIQLEEERKHLEQSLAIIKSFKDEQLENIATQIKEYPEGYKGYNIEVRNGGVMYDFKHIPEWKEYKQLLVDCEARYKSALVAKEHGNAFANVSDDGEELPLPQVSYRKSSVIVKKQG